MSETKPIRSLLVKSLFIIGIFIVVLILTFAVIKIIPRVFSSFANVGDSINSPFANNQNSLDLSTETTRVNANTPIYIDWDFEPQENGAYELTYSCANYLEVELGTTDGNREIKCDTIYNLSPTTQRISLLPKVTRDNVLVDMPLSIRYVNRSGNVVAKDDIDFMITKRAEGNLAGSGSIVNTETISTGDVETNNQPTPNQGTTQNTNQNTTNNQPTQTTNQPVTINRGTPDLRIYDAFATNDTTIIFSISNSGSASTGAWYFNYAMPDGDVASSPMQASLRPGEAIRFTLRLQDIPRGSVGIAVDPRNNIFELSEINNFAAIEVRGDGGRNDDRDNNNYNRNDRADLEIDDLEVGYMNGSRFIEDDRIDERDDAAVRFMVYNRGGESTGLWRFSIENLPYDDGRDEYESNRQPSLRPGESREIIVEFENPDEGRYNIVVELDSDDDVREEDERNNDDSATLRVER